MKVTGLFIAVIMFLIVAAPCCAYDGPVVVDDANFFDAKQLIEIEHEVAKVNSKNDFLLVVLTVPTLGGQNIMPYSKAVMRVWGIGHEGRDDGLLLLIVKDEMIFHFQAGKRVEKALGNKFLKHIEDDILAPAFKRKDSFAGLSEGIDVLASGKKKSALYLWLIPIVLLLIPIYANTLNRKRRICPHCKEKVSPVVSRCPHCLEDIRVKQTEPCPCGSNKPYRECCFDKHCDGRQSHRLQFLRMLDIRYLMSQSTSFGGYTGGGTGELPPQSPEKKNFDGTVVTGGW